jgi:hypothetical protein
MNFDLSASITTAIAFFPAIAALACRFDSQIDGGGDKQNRRRTNQSISYGGENQRFGQPGQFLHWANETFETDSGKRG